MQTILPRARFDVTKGEPPEGRSPRENRDPLADEVQQRALTSVSAFYDEFRADLLRRLVRAYRHDATHQDLYRIAQQLFTEYVPPLTRILTDAQLAAWLTGASRVASLPDVAPFPGHAGAVLPPLPPIGTTTSLGDEWDWSGMRVWLPIVGEAIADLQSRRLVTRDDFDRMTDQAKAEAFTVAGLQTQEALETVRTALVEVQQEGEGLGAFRAKMDEHLETSAIGPGHLENILRTNTAQAATAGEEAIVNHPIVSSGFPYESQDIIDDSRVTDLCYAIAHAGIGGSNVYRRDDPVIIHFRKPRHWQCRCGRTFLTLEDAARRGIKEAQKWLETGYPPDQPEYVPWPNVELPPGWTPGGVRMSVSFVETQHPRDKGGEFTKIGSGNTGDVHKVGDEVVKSARLKDGSMSEEGKVYKALAGVRGIVAGQQVGDKIRMPFYKHIMSVDAVPRERRASMAAIVSKNKGRINEAVTALSNAGYSYNDPLQFGVGEGHKLDLLDFSNASKGSIDQALTDNLGHLRSFYEEFGMPAESKRIGRVGAVLQGMQYIGKGEDELGFWDGEIGEATVAKLKSQLGEKEPKYAYYATNGRHISIGGIAQTEPEDGLKVILSDKPLAADDMEKWEITPVVHLSADAGGVR